MTDDKYVSPYLMKEPRSVEQVMAERKCPGCLGEGVGYFFVWDNAAGCRRWTWIECPDCHGTGKAPTREKRDG